MPSAPSPRGQRAATAALIARAERRIEVAREEPAAHRLGAPLTPDALRGTPRRLRLLCPPASETKDPDEGDACDDEDEGEPGHSPVRSPRACLRPQLNYTRRKTTLLTFFVAHLPSHAGDNYYHNVERIQYSRRNVGKGGVHGREEEDQRGEN